MYRHPDMGLRAPRKWTWLDYYLKWSPTMRLLGKIFPPFDLSQVPYPEERDQLLAENRDLHLDLALLKTAWQPIETAPKDGTNILLLSKEHTDPADINGGPYHYPPKCSIGRWDPKADSWCDQYGRYPDDPEVDEDTINLRVTGVWMSGGGWFQPNEVTHWQPLPAPPPVIAD